MTISGDTLFFLAVVASLLMDPIQRRDTIQFPSIYNFVIAQVCCQSTSLFECRRTCSLMLQAGTVVLYTGLIETCPSYYVVIKQLKAEYLPFPLTSCFCDSQSGSVPCFWNARQQADLVGFAMIAISVGRIWWERVLPNAHGLNDLCCRLCLSHIATKSRLAHYSLIEIVLP